MDISNARSFVVSLLVKCPFDVHVYGCCLQELRGGALNDTMEVVKRLTDAEVQHILDEHKKCLFRRESG